MDNDLRLRAGEINAKNMTIKGGLTTKSGNPSPVYALDIDGITTVMLALEIRCLAEAIREMIMAKKASSWTHSFNGKTVLSFSMSDKDAPLTYNITLVQGDTVQHAAFDKWEIRSLLKQLEFLIEKVESKVYDFVWKLSAAASKNP